MREYELIKKYRQTKKGVLTNILMDFVTEALTNPQCIVVSRWLNSEVEVKGGEQ